MDGSSWLELRRGGQPPTTVELDRPLTFGRQIVGGEVIEGHIGIAGDPTISRLHVGFDRQGPGWCAHALQATNGVFINGDRLAEGALRLLLSGDEIRLGERTTLVFHSIEANALDRSRTQAAVPVPELTAAERRVLLQLCRPLIDGDTFTPPSRVSEIARKLFVTESAVKQHLIRLYRKFGIDGEGDRRVRLANDAIQRGAVRRADLEGME